MLASDYLLVNSRSFDANPLSSWRLKVEVEKSTVLKNQLCSIGRKKIGCSDKLFSIKCGATYLKLTKFKLV
jgi:hypothetical protein